MRTTSVAEGVFGNFFFSNGERVGAPNYLYNELFRTNNKSQNSNENNYQILSPLKTTVRILVLEFRWRFPLTLRRGVNDKQIVVIIFHDKKNLVPITKNERKKKTDFLKGSIAP